MAGGTPGQRLRKPTLVAPGREMGRDPFRDVPTAGTVHSRSLSCPIDYLYPSALIHRLKSRFRERPPVSTVHMNRNSVWKAGRVLDVRDRVSVRDYRRPRYKGVLDLPWRCASMRSTVYRRRPREALRRACAGDYGLNLSATSFSEFANAVDPVPAALHIADDVALVWPPCAGRSPDRQPAHPRWPLGITALVHAMRTGDGSMICPPGSHPSRLSCQIETRCQLYPPVFATSDFAVCHRYLA